jgi:plasmid stabilization system protein ParE
MAEVIFRQQAWRDLERISSRIKQEDPGAAERFRANVLHRLRLLERSPEAVQPRPEFGSDIRTIPIGRYIVA